MLVRVAKDALNKVGWPTEVLTGRLMFPLGSNERNVSEPDTEDAKL
jgi:hypothetical protein